MVYFSTMSEQYVIPKRQCVGRLIVGNCVDVMRGWADGCIDLTVTSPPYDSLRDYKGYDFPFEAIADELYRVTAPGGVLVWVVGDRINGGRSLSSFRQALYFQQIGFSAHDIMIYQKKNTPFMRSNAYTNAYEMMFVLSKGKPATFNPLKTPTKRNGFELLTHNKLPDGINKKKRGELKKEKTRTNIWSYAVGLGRHDEGQNRLPASRRLPREAGAGSHPVVEQPGRPGAGSHVRLWHDRQDGAAA